MCRNCKPRNRPSFRQILLHLDIASADVLSTPQETYFKSQVRHYSTIAPNIKNDTPEIKNILIMEGTALIERTKNEFHVIGPCNGAAKARDDLSDLMMIMCVCVCV